ncbi:MAG: DUF1858 domain-containing protein, partial [Planctomycetes bacterium]|nr:DUF1858 domain-containing protein [Planctomycetota bacterium]
TGSMAFAVLLEASVIAFTAAAGVLTWQLGILHLRAEKDRSVKFLRAAYAWLFVSLFLLILFPAYLALLGHGFSHAYFGATRHAVTVGFISLMIVGVASKVVPTLNGVPAAALPGLWAPFILINVGCYFRVVFQILTDFTPAAFPVAGSSGVLEVAGLGLWGVHVARVLAGRYRFALAGGFAGGAPARASPEHIVGWLTRVAPETIPVFERMGFTAITNRLLRETVARTVTVRQACALKGIEEAKLLEALDEVFRARAAAPRPAEIPAASAAFLGKISRSET